MALRGHKVRDSQRSKVYKWEKYLLATHSPPTLSECDSVSLVEKLWSSYRKDCPPSVYFPPTGKWARGQRTRISLPPWSRTDMVIAHELTHALTDKPEISWHGPEFVGLLAEMLIKYLGYSPKIIQESIGLFGLKCI